MNRKYFNPARVMKLFGHLTLNWTFRSSCIKHLLISAQIKIIRLCFLMVISIFLITDCSAQSKASGAEIFDGYFISKNIPYLKSRLETLNQNIAKYGILKFGDSEDKLLTGYSYGEFYDWDLYFENIYLSYYGITKYNFTNLKLFLERQHINGFISRTLKEPRPYQHFKPFLAQIALLGSKQTGDYTWLLQQAEGAKEKGPREGGIMDERYFVDGRSYYERLKLYIRYWFWYQDFDKNGLPVWNSADHSGMDNQDSRAGYFNSFRYEGVDLACYLYRELKSMSFMAEKLGMYEDSDNFSKQADKLASRINDYFWNEEDGFYYDRDEWTGQPVRVKSIAGFMPLYTGIASPEQADRLVKEHLLNEEEFWSAYPIPAYSMSEPDYDPTVIDHGCNWRGTTWIPTNYMVIHGLMDYGYKDVAEEIVKRTFRMVLELNSSTREYFNGETGSGLGLNPFFGWTSLGYLLPLEFELEYDPTDINDEEIIPLAKEYLDIDFPVNNK